MNNQSSYKLYSNFKGINFLKLFSFSLLILCTSLLGRAEEVVSKSKKEIDFDDQVVESYKLTSAGDVELVGKRDLRKNPYLFRKKLHFRPDTASSLQEVGYAP